MGRATDERLDRERFLQRTGEPAELEGLRAIWEGYVYTEPAGKGYGEEGKGKTVWATPMAQDVERKTLGKMRTAAAALYNLEGFEEQLANLRLEIKVQQRNSNQEGETSREDQATYLLQSFTYKKEWCSMGETSDVERRDSDDIHITGGTGMDTGTTGTRERQRFREFGRGTGVHASNCRSREKTTESEGNIIEEKAEERKKGNTY
eukprot:2273961-Heterocapsa_arctica.AAC.1